MENIEISNNINFNRKEYIEGTAYSPQNIEIEKHWDYGTEKITEELASQLVKAVTERVYATEKFNKERVEKIKKAESQYNLKIFDDNSDDNKNYPETRMAVEDWVDDLVMSLSELADAIELESDGGNLRQLFQKMLTIDADEGQLTDKIKTSITNSIMAHPSINGNEEAAQEALSQIFMQPVKTNDIYHFSKADAIKSFLKKQINHCGIYDKDDCGRSNLVKYLVHGLLSGEFCHKEVWGATEVNRLTQKKQIPVEAKFNAGISEGTSGKFEYSIERVEKYQFIPIDTRNLIYPEYNRSWVIEKIEKKKFSDLLTDVYDYDGKVLDFPLYDDGQIKKAAAYLKKNNKPTSSRDESDVPEKTHGIEDVELNDIWQLDGLVDVYEAHSIPIKHKGRVIKSLITLIKLGDDKFIPIRFKPYPYFTGLAIKFTALNDSRMGLPQIMESLQDTLNTLYGLLLDMLNMALWGILAVDENVISDPKALMSLNPKQAIALKNMEGRSINNVIQWWTPPLQITTYVMQMFQTTSEMIKRVSRKGASTERISPNTTATEFDSLAKEKQKSVALVLENISRTLSEFISNTYVYNLINKDEAFKLTVKGKRIPEDETLNKLIFQEVEKFISLEPEDLYVEGLNFKINLVDSYNTRSIEKMQSMQLLNAIMPLSIDGQGQQIVYKDESDNDVVIDTYKLIDNVAKKISGLDIWKKYVNAKSNLIPTPASGPVTSPQQGTQAGSAAEMPSAPPLNTMPQNMTEGSILSGIMNQQ